MPARLHRNLRRAKTRNHSHSAPAMRATGLPGIKRGPQKLFVEFQGGKRDARWVVFLFALKRQLLFIFLEFFVCYFINLNKSLKTRLF
jgi:hypothetical protein